MVWYLLTLGLEMSFVLWALRWRPMSLASLTAINFVLIVILGSIVTDLFGIASRIGNIYFATIIVILYILYGLYGQGAFLSTIYRCIFSVGCFTMLSFFITVTLCEDELGIQCYSARQLLTRAPNLYTSTFLAFIVSQMVFILMSRWCAGLPRATGYLVVALAVQLSHSVIHSLLILPDRHIMIVGELFFSGMIHKMIVHVLFLPVIILALSTKFKQKVECQKQHPVI